MADVDCFYGKFLIIFTLCVSNIQADDILGCGGFVKSHVNLDFSKIEIGLYTKSGSLKERTECAPTNGYYFLPLYEKGEYLLKVHPPPGWSFEPSEMELRVDGTTDPCSTGQDINFAFNGFGIAGRVITAGQKQGPSGISVQLENDAGEKWDTVTAPGGDFHFTPIIPGKYTVKASHPKWKLDPSQAVVQVKEGNTALPEGVLAVKGYDVTGTVTAFGQAMPRVYVLLYSKEESPKFRVEGCNTALLQGVPDAPICHSITDHSGQFSFGLVPAGEYKLIALSKNPGQVTVTYNVKPDEVKFTVAHGSLFIKNAFEVTSFTVVGSVLTHQGGSGLPTARVSVDGNPVAVSDAKGTFTLAQVTPGTYTVAVQHEQCEIEPLKLSIPPTGALSPPQLVVARWRVCGVVSPPSPRTLAVSGDRQSYSSSVDTDGQGQWCTMLPPGTYILRVEVTESEQSEGLQFYPPLHKLSVSHGPVDGVTFSQLKAKVTGTVQCKKETNCDGVTVTLRYLTADGRYTGLPVTTSVKSGAYEFTSILPGSIEVSVLTGALCWLESAHIIAVTSETAVVPPFSHVAYGINIQTSHDTQVEYKTTGSTGVLPIPAGETLACVKEKGQYTLTPTGCHRFQPASAVALTHHAQPPVVTFEAVSHAVEIRVISPEPVKDLILRISTDQGTHHVGPMESTKLQAGGYQYTHTLYMAEGDISVVSAESSSLLFHPSDPQQVIGSGACQPDALTLRAVKGLTLTGQVKPAVEGVTVTLTADDIATQSQTTSSAGTYTFGPLDASKRYAVSAAKEGYTFTATDHTGDIVAHKLAEITLKVVDDADGTPLQGALVSVSGGSYRRNTVSGPDGTLVFAALAPIEYYVKGHMKEYRLTPPSTIVKVLEGRTSHVELRGVRTAWSVVGRLVSLGGAGWPGVVLQVAPSNQQQGNCAPEEATTDSDGSFRIRGLVPKCVYSIQLMQAPTIEGGALKLAKAPPAIEIKEKRDIEDVVLIAIQPHQTTDANVLIYTTNIDHYKTLRLTLALETSPTTAVYSTKLDAAGYSQYMNPGLMYVLPRLPADNKTYVLQLESTLSKATHSYMEEAIYFNSDGNFKSFNIDFVPKVKLSEQELRQTSLLFLPLLALLYLAYHHRDQLVTHLKALLEQAVKPRVQVKEQRELLDKASIHYIVNSVNAAGKRVGKKKTI